MTENEVDIELLYQLVYDLQPFHDYGLQIIIFAPVKYIIKPDDEFKIIGEYLRIYGEETKNIPIKQINMIGIEVK